MIDQLMQWDEALFRLINGWHSPFWDTVMWAVSAKLTWLPLYLFILGWMIRIYRRRFWVLLLFIVLLVVLTDQVSVQLFKKVFLRLRPCHQEALAATVHLVKGHCGGMYGFVSSHASNMFGVAMFSSLLIRNRTYTWLIFLWAAWVGYSRIYLGVHFPGDVVGGALLGSLLGWLVYRMWRFAGERWLDRRPFFAAPEKKS
jgi:undecaprenyl-diphosphatase